MPIAKTKKARVKVVVLVGLPASGKSYYAKKVTKEAFIIINQDTLKTREKCIELAKLSLKNGVSIIIDRCNISRKQRQHWIGLAKQFGAELECVVFDPHADLSCQNAELRKEHPNFPSDPIEIEKIVRKFEKDYEPPTKEEGFKTISHHHTYHGFPNTYFYRE
jgi:bifunctional polynucleotide phosphatase/kinase